MQKMMEPRFEVQVKVSYIESESRPEKNYYFFAYHVKITNLGASPAQLMSRHWVITDNHGQQDEVRGPGVVGLQPRILPGQSFEYDSACPLPTPSGTMRGQYHMVSDSGSSFSVDIPEFYLIAPQCLH